MDYENGHPFGHFRIEGKKFGLWAKPNFKYPFNLSQEFIRKDRRKELLYYVNLIRAC